MNIPVNIYQDENGIYIAESPILEGFHTYGKNTTIPIHKNEDLPIGTLRNILKDLSLSIDDVKND